VLKHVEHRFKSSLKSYCKRILFYWYRGKITSLRSSSLYFCNALVEKLATCLKYRRNTFEKSENSPKCRFFSLVKNELKITYCSCVQSTSYFRVKSSLIINISNVATKFEILEIDVMTLSSVSSVFVSRSSGWCTTVTHIGFVILVVFFSWFCPIPSGECNVA